MKPPVQSFVDLRDGKFRTLTWGDGPETVLFLHGLSGVSEVWGPTVANLPTDMRYVALDQRGHGQSPSSPELKYTPGSFVSDTVQAINALGGPVHLVGHSMGARIAMLVAARRPELTRSVAIVDIGPEASKSNIEATTRGIRSRPDHFISKAAALAFAFRSRQPTPDDEAIFLARLRQEKDGKLTWLSPVETLVACVSSQRNQSYWRDWKAISGPGLYVHGGTSNEVTVFIADKMRAMNPRLGFIRLDGVGHNIPLIAPALLAAELTTLWQSTTAKLT